MWPSQRRHCPRLVAPYKGDKPSRNLYTVTNMFIMIIMLMTIIVVIMISSYTAKCKNWDSIYVQNVCTEYLQYMYRIFMVYYKYYTKYTDSWFCVSGNQTHSYDIMNMNVYDIS